MRAGMTLAERQELRQHYLDKALAAARVEAARVYRSIRCQFAQQPSDHDSCRGESSANGCLCPCHDPAPAETPAP